MNLNRWVEFRNQVLQQPNGQAILVSGRPDNHDVTWISKQIEQLIQVWLTLAATSCAQNALARAVLWLWC